MHTWSMVAILITACASPPPPRPAGATLAAAVPEPAPVDGGAAPVLAPEPRAAPDAPAAQLATSPPRASRAAAGTHRLTVTIHGTGAILGGVRSEPAGIDCILASRDAPGMFSKTCSADLAAGAITLRFVPGGASSLGQFTVRSGATQQRCDGTSCSVQLAADTTVEVHPISVPPPPGP